MYFLRDEVMFLLIHSFSYPNVMNLLLISYLNYFKLRQPEIFRDKKIILAGKSSNRCIAVWDPEYLWEQIHFAFLPIFMFVNYCSNLSQRYKSFLLKKSEVLIDLNSLCQPIHIFCVMNTHTKTFVCSSKFFHWTYTWHQTQSQRFQQQMAPNVDKKFALQCFLNISSNLLKIFPHFQKICPIFTSFRFPEGKSHQDILNVKSKKS